MMRRVHKDEYIDPITELVVIKLLESLICDRNVYGPLTMYEQSDEHQSQNSGDKKYPEHVTRELENWMLKNVNNPYPNENEKAQLCAKTGRNLSQINNWMSNYRRRKIKKPRGLNGRITAGKQKLRGPNGRIIGHK
jgi:homeobox protein TGIF1